ncbi:MAG: T9SS type A sorting domain-containing protein, partial [Candidatus Kapabacteria bacterium]|nr:T9SS type A sorting domain-containing protein [Candidatus Kapabacteria bacterium]
RVMVQAPSTSVSINASDIGTEYKQFTWEVRGLGDWGGRSETAIPYTFSTDGTLSVDLPGESNAVRVEPNPATDVVRIRYAVNSTSPVSLVLTDNMGNDALVTTAPAEGTESSIEIPLGGLLSGVYTVRIRQEGSRELRKRIVVVR